MRRVPALPALAFALVLGVALAGCGGAPPPEASPPIAVAPLGVPPSFLPGGTPVVARLDPARARDGAIAESTRRARNDTDWAALVATLGLDPLLELDVLVVGCPALAREGCTLVARHPSGEEHVRARAVAITGGAWTEREGLAVLELPTQPYVLAITAPGELVLAPAHDLGRIAAVARDHAARRAASGRSGALDPALTSTRDTELATLSIGTPLELPVRIGGDPPIPQQLRVDVDARTDGGADVAVRAAFATVEEAGAAAAWWETLRARGMANLLVRIYGLTDALEAATLRSDGVRVELHVPLGPAAVGTVSAVAASVLRRGWAGASQGEGASPAAPSPAAPSPAAPSPAAP